MKASRVTIILRVVLGLMLVLTGLNKFFHFMPTPPGTPELQAFLHALVASGYLMALVGGLESVVGVMLVTDRFVPLALLLLTPISVNIVLAHAVLDPSGIAPGALVAALNLALCFAYRDHYLPLLESN